MKGLFIVAALAAAPVLAAAPAIAQGQGQGQALHARTGAELAQLCAANGKDPAGAARLNFCLGYAQATFDLEMRHAKDRKPFCIPTPSPTRVATMSEFANWVRNSNEARAMNAQEALMKFMAQRFPCK
ncbi:MAG: Rap1a/Tai family immunity protein [Acetobacteraceae bacterium]